MRLLVPASTRAPALVLLVLAACQKDKDAPADDTEPDSPAPCEAPAPPAEALQPAGWVDGVLVLPDGRALTPAGTLVELGGFPADVAIAETASGTAVGLVTNAHRHTRSLEVVRLSDGAVLDEVDRTDAFPGFAVAGQRVYASGGNANQVDVYDLQDDGTVVQAASWPVGEYPTGLQLSADGGTLYAALFQDQAIVAVDVATGAVTATFPTGLNPYGLALSADGQSLWASGFGDEAVVRVDIATGDVGTFEVGRNPAGIALDGDGFVWVAVSNEDKLVVLDPGTGAVVATVDLREDTVASEEGPLPGTSPSALTIDGDTLYVARAADNAVGVVDTVSRTLSGNIPTAWYPTGVAVRDGVMLVSEGKGIGTGPNSDGTFVSDAMVGTATIVALDAGSLPAWSEQVAASVQRPGELYDFGDCAGTFPIPRKPGDPTPIEHVVLIVRENKTYDALLGDLDLPDADRDPALAEWGEWYTPNIHALAATFGNHDNFYDNSESSVQGHLWLTSSLVNEYMERAWIEDYHGVGTFADDSVTEVGRPDFGTIFTHLLEHGVEIRNYGEIVGALDAWSGGSVIDYVDTDFPGGFFNTEVKDEDKARYAAEKLFTDGDFPPFVYLLLPNDHTGGAWSDEVMIADNDYGTGLFIDALSHSPYWESTVVFIVEDDPQSALDHVDAHRSILVAVSPWVKRGHTSHVITSYPSVFRTIEQILGVPPMNRYDALATPLWDTFTSTPDNTPFTVVPRNFDDDGNPTGPTAPPAERRARDPLLVQRALEARRCLDLSGPDRNPFLHDIMLATRLGWLPADSILRETSDCEELWEWAEGVEGAEAEEDAYDDAWRAFEAWKAANPGRADHVRRPAAPRWREEEEEEEEESR